MTTTILKAGARAVRLVRETTRTVRLAVDADVPIITYYTHNANWGDALNPVLVEHLSGHRPVLVGTGYDVRHRPVYSVIGSVLGVLPHPRLEVWGSGFISETSTFRVPPARVHAVRGPLTREMVLRQGVHCPEVYGDPALLYPRFYRPDAAPRYDVGLVPHYMDQDAPWLRQLAEHDSVRVIDVLSGVTAFVDAVCSCRFIASSSLHGLIAADAYGIPFTWMELSDRVLGAGFKFRDYFASTGRPPLPPVIATEETTVQELLDHRIEPTPDIDLDRLLVACPFRARAGTRR